MTFGRETDEAGSHAQLDAFVEAGGTLVDTADVYAGGASEEIIGRWLAEPARRRPRPGRARHQGPLPDGRRRRTTLGLSRRHLQRALDASLRRLGVEGVDLYQVHAWDPLTPLEETLRFLDDAVRAGQDPLRRAVELHRLAGAEDRRPRRRARGLAAPGDPAAAVQPAGPRDRVGDRARLPGRRARAAALVAARRRLADRQVPARRAARPAPPGSARTPTRGVEAYDRRSAQRAHLGRRRRGARRSPRPAARRWRRSPWPGWSTGPAVTSVILGARTTEQLDRQPRRRRPAPDAGRDRRARRGQRPGAADYPYGGPGTEQRSRRIEGGR